MISETKITVRYAETDRMGIVHHSNYPVWFEAGRTDLIKTIGMTYSDIENMGLLLPLIEMKCRFLSSAGYEDELIVKSKVSEVSYVRITFNYEVYNIEKNILIAKGETMHVWTDKNLKPMNLYKKYPDIYMKMKTAME